MTNVLEVLHMTAAYHAAAAQLLIGQANFVARQIGIHETFPSDTNLLAKMSIEPPPQGMSGTIGTSNYVFMFARGYPCFLREDHWLRRIQPPGTNVYDLAGKPCLLDTNGAFQLATQWLAALSIDVAALEKAYPRMVLQYPNRKPREAAAHDHQTHLPLFLVRWGPDYQRTAFGSPVGIKILGTTKEIVELFIGDTNFFTCPPITLTNTAELLGPLPPKRKFVEDFVGGPDAYHIIAEPDSVEVVLMGVKDRNFGNSPIVERTQSVCLKSELVSDASTLFLEFDSYRWRVKMLHWCSQYAKVTFSRGERKIVFLICPECNDIHITSNGRGWDQNFQPAHDRLMKILRRAFPKREIAKWLR